MRLKHATKIQTDLDNLPTARELKLFGIPAPDDKTMGEAIDVPNYKAIEVTHDGRSKVVRCPSNRYKLVQHKDAFAPILNGMRDAGINEFEYSIVANHNRAQIQIYTGAEGGDTVKLGFVVSNSFDSTQSIRYGFTMNRSTSTLEVVGYRQVCSNGMKIRVPLSEARIIRREVVERIKVLHREAMRVRHTQNAESRMREAQYIAEVLGLLQDPVKAMIANAQGTPLSVERVNDLLERYVRSRRRDAVLALYNRDGGSSLWDLYNAMTYHATHEVSSAHTRERIVDSAANLLLLERVDA